jgi:hypothetical protein
VRDADHSRLGPPGILSIFSAEHYTETIVRKLIARAGQEAHCLPVQRIMCALLVVSFVSRIDDCSSSASHRQILMDERDDGGALSDGCAHALH